MKSFRLVILLAIGYSINVNACRWNNLQVKVSQNLPSEAYLVMEVKNDVQLWTYQTPRSGRLDQFNQMYGKYLKGQQRNVMQRQLNFFSQGFGIRSGDYLLKRAIFDGQVGQLTSARCFELLLLDEHLKYNVLPTLAEYGAYIFIKTLGGEQYLRILFQSTKAAFINSNSRVESDIKTSIKDGWKMFAHLHSHPFIIEAFLAGNDAGGAVWPSGDGQPNNADFGTYLRLKTQTGLQQAWITNGFDTFYLKSEEFEKLRRIATGTRARAANER